ncbi:MAG TPA: transcriptional regulator, partial [Blastocatellia bacterium]|nr:transcriptional regulator [Blastocatellia bacterium]
MSPHSKHIYSFGPFRLDPNEHLLLHEGKPVSLTPKVFDLLLVLVKHQGRLLEKDELMRAVWPDTVVEEANLSANISILRKALGDGLNEQSLIETVPKRGYRFIAPVREEDEEDSEESPSAGDQPSDSPMTGEESKNGARWRTASRSWRLLSVALLLLLAAAGITYLQRVRGG